MGWIARMMPLRSWLMIGAIVVAFMGLSWAILSWGQARYDAGVKDTDDRWKAAGERLEAQARKGATEASRREAERVSDHAEQLAAEKEKIDEAVADGRSPLDALFGGL